MSNATETPHHPTFDVLRVYFFLVYLATCATMALFWQFAETSAWTVKLYVGLATAGYAALYTLAPLALTSFAGWLLQPDRRTGDWRRRLLFLIAWLSGTLTLLAIYADYRLYALYEYHFNGFVWNLITTPGGISALGATESTLQAVAFQIGLLFLVTASALWLLHRHLRSRSLVTRRILLAGTGVLLLALVSEEGVYAYSTHTGQEEFLQAAEVVPFHLQTSATGLFSRLGIKRTALTKLRIAGGKVDYPAHDLPTAARDKLPNIIMLVGESFRWDLLDPEITPNLWKLAGKSLRFEHHYSGGNRTRMGLFSMFYGIYAPYWYSFESQRVAPAFMEFLRARSYQLALHTSQSFDYPELRHTLFTGVPEQYLQELKTGEPWKRDRQNISDIIVKLDQRDRQRPFFGFMFFESTHAPYTFPDEAAIRPDYQKDLNYINMNLRDNVARIHARYINAAHHVDHEVGRLLDHLERTGLLDDTIVLFTGDHGEEFMEKGHWGHGHSRTFPEEQIRVPLVLHLPGRAPAVISHRTSHLEIAPTLLAELGVREDPHTYSSASTLFTPAPYFVVGEYDHMGIIDEHHKITFPYTGSDFFRYTVHDADDRPVARERRKEIVEQYQSRLDAVVAESRRFVR